MYELDDIKSDDEPIRELALFAGAGGGILAGKLLGWRTVCGVERDAYAAGVLAQRQNDGSLSPFPIWSDITTFDGTRWRGRVDVVSGGFPCQDISCAGKGGGIDGARSGLWVEMARVVREVQPRIVYVENSPMLTSRGLGVVLGDLAALGYYAEWGVLSAADVGADHIRERVWIVAHSDKLRREGGRVENLEPPAAIRKLSKIPPSWQVRPGVTKNKPPGACICRGSDGVAFILDRLKAIGNGQVPQCAAEAFRQLMDRAIGNY